MSGTRLYTLWQILYGTFLGGPLAAIYFLKKNFDELGNEELAHNTLRYGGLGVLFLAIIVPFLSEDFPQIIVPVICAILARSIAEHYQFQKLEPHNYNTKTHSHWKVIGIAILSSIAFLGFFMIVYSLMSMIGVAPDLVPPGNPAALEQTVAPQ